MAEISSIIREYYDQVMSLPATGVSVLDESHPIHSDPVYTYLDDSGKNLFVGERGAARFHALKQSLERKTMSFQQYAGLYEEAMEDLAKF